MFITTFNSEPKIEKNRTGPKVIIHGFAILGRPMDLAEILYIDSTSKDKLNGAKKSSYLLPNSSHYQSAYSHVTGSEWFTIFGR